MLRCGHETIVAYYATYVIGYDETAGKRARYTVWRLARRGDKRGRIIGRELSLPDARRRVSDDIWFGKKP